ncbi:hypothetical protein [Algibacter mikhailovii]|uniref:Uncharacterized protein n=1 Tax=Algibacter mikhailovii TaxID=425498 RepID=A0A918RC89_9FLAO|nr:hypothetical protein [Algibacter mikhailovii]GGZ92161.1 hypothetical protein GCM10007028_33290 [Algibacter mikhailovii]
MAKQTQPSINLKLSEGLKTHVKLKARLKGKTVSKYIRELLADYLDGSLCIPEQAKQQRKTFVNSTAFLKLVVWMYSKKESSEIKETELELDGYIETLKKGQEHLPKTLVLELDKVLVDLLRIKMRKLKYVGFDFAKEYDKEKGFNFKILEQFIAEFEQPRSLDFKLPKSFKRGVFDK